MCSPTFLLMAGSVVQGISGYAKAQNDAANYRVEQKAAERDADLQHEQGAYEGARAYERGRQLIGKQVAGYASHGISPSSGSAADVITSTGADVGLDIAASRYGTQRAIENDKYRSRVAKMNANNAAASAPLAFLTPVLSAQATVLKGGYA